MKKVRFGMLGAGGIADRRTMPGMLLAENAEIVAVMELRADRAELLREKYGAKSAYIDEEALIKDPEVDAVYIASPVVCHARQAKLCADYGKHILIEKPIAMTAKEGEEVLTYCQSRGVLVAVGLMMRYGAHVMQMKDEIAAGKIGNVVSGYSQFTCYLPPSSGNWRLSKEKSGGGCLIDMGVHCVDLMEYITGMRALRVAALSDTLTFDYDVEDSCTLLMQMENGAHCIVQTNFNIPDEAAKWRMEFFGTAGRLLGDNIIGQIDGGELRAVYTAQDSGYDAQQDHDGVSEERLTAQYGNMYTREVESFAASILEGKPLVAPAEDALRVQRILEAAYQSAETRRFVEL